MSDKPTDGWATHAMEQRRAWLRLSYADRLRWLEQAKRFAEQALRAAKERRASAPRG
jgi:hypothetical protein